MASIRGRTRGGVTASSFVRPPSSSLSWNAGVCPGSARQRASMGRRAQVEAEIEAEVTVGRDRIGARSRARALLWRRGCVETTAPDRAWRASQLITSGRAALFVAHGAWCVVRGAWCVVRCQSYMRDCDIRAGETYERVACHTYNCQNVAREQDSERQKRGEAETRRGRDAAAAKWPQTAAGCY
jgi:hypothetical protein